MKPKGLALATVMILILSEVATGQPRFTGFAGYNAFNEIYGGIQSTSKSKVNYAFELTYRQAITQNASYYFGFLPSPFLLNSASGMGIRTSLVYSTQPTKHRHLFVSLQYRDLKTTTIIKDDGAYGGSTMAPYAEFRDSYKDIWILGSHVLPFLESNRLCFTYSWGITARYVWRQYSKEGRYRPSNREDRFWTVAPQLTAGFRYYFSKASVIQ